MRVSGKTCHP